MYERTLSPNKTAGLQQILGRKSELAVPDLVTALPPTLIYRQMI